MARPAPEVLNIGDAPPYCPTTGLEAGNSVDPFAYPSATVVEICLGGVCALLALVILVKYDTVRVFRNKHVSRNDVSNVRWCIWYSCLALRSALQAVRLGLAHEYEDETVFDETLYAFIFLFHGIAVFALCMALSHQRTFRTAATTNLNGVTEVDDPALGPLSLRQMLLSRTGAFAVLLAAFLITSVLKIFFFWDSDILLGFFLAAFFLQRVPVILLVVAIVMQRSHVHTNMPSKFAKASISIGCLITLLNDTPAAFWASVLPDTCDIGDQASYVDLVRAASVIAPAAFFFYLRSEHKRSIEETLWQVVTSTQYSFDVRRY